MVLVRLFYCLSYSENIMHEGLKFDDLRRQAVTTHYSGLMKRMSGIHKPTAISWCGSHTRRIGERSSIYMLRGWSRFGSVTECPNVWVPPVEPSEIRYALNVR